MAFGTITVLKRVGGNSGSPRTDVITIVGDGAYPTGGTAAFETAVSTALGVGTIDIVGVIMGDCGGYQAVYDHVNDKLKMYRADYDAVADGALVEVPNATSLAAVTLQLTIISV